MGSGTTVVKLRCWNAGMNGTPNAGFSKRFDTSYILEVYFDDDNSIAKIKYKSLPNLPNSFQRATVGSFKWRSLIMGGKNSNRCFEFNQEEYQNIPSLNVNRYDAASSFIRNKVVIAGGDDGGRYLDTIEILDLDESNHGSQWIESPSKSPFKVVRHTLVTFENKLYVIGGSYGRLNGYGRLVMNDLDTIWQGTIWKLGQNKRISWVKMCLRLQKKRSSHFSFVISNQIIIFGGHVEGEDFVEILERKELKQGPKVPFELNASCDQAVLDRKDRIIITSHRYGLIVYDHKQGTFKMYGSFKLKEKLDDYAAILQ